MAKWRTFVSIVEGKCSLTLSVVVAPSGAHRLLVATIGIVCVLRRTYLAEDAKIADGELHSDGIGRVDVAKEGGEELGELALGAEGDLVAVAVDIGQGDGISGDVEEILDAGSEVIPSWGRLEDDHAGAAVELRELDVKLGGRHCAVLQESEGRLAENGGAYIGVGRVTAVGTWRCRNAAQGGGGGARRGRAVYESLRHTATKSKYGISCLSRRRRRAGSRWDTRSATVSAVKSRQQRKCPYMLERTRMHARRSGWALTLLGWSMVFIKQQDSHSTHGFALVLRCKCERCYLLMLCIVAKGHGSVKMYCG